MILVQIVLGNEQENENADLNEDGSIDVLDVVQLIQYIINN